MSVIDYVNEAGVMPTYNFKEGVFEHAKKINGYEMLSKYKIGDTACFACPMACGNVCLVKEGKYRGTVVEGPEYETACMFGSNIGVSNFAAIVKGNQLCDELGVDTITAGNLIGVLMEALETGLLTEKDLDGLPLKWGNEDADHGNPSADRPSKGDRKHSCRGQPRRHQTVASASPDHLSGERIRAIGV